MKRYDAKFGVGQLIRHRLFNYRGVVFDVDMTFQGSEEWYDKVAQTRPPRDKPWYHVLVHNAAYTTYVAERNLMLDDSNEPVRHPDIELYFSGFDETGYHATRRGN